MKACYDCGSTLPKHHTFFCDFAGPRDRRDLPAHFGTQHWNGSPPISASKQKINKLHESLPATKPLPYSVLTDYETQLRALA